MLIDLLFELLLLFSSVGVELIDILLNSSDLLGLLVLQSADDFSLGVELSLELSL